MNKAKFEVESKDSMDKYDFIVDSVDEMDDGIVKCWRIWINNIHIQGDHIRLSRGVCYVNDSNHNTYASFNMEDVKTLRFNVDDPFKIYKFEFED